MKKIGRYEIIEKIGEGGMGTVYKALLPTLNRTVALKVLSDSCVKDEELLQRFLREARIMASLSDYTHVVQVFDLDEYEGGYFYTMEFIPTSLAHLLGEGLQVEDRTRRIKKKKRRLKVSTAIKIAMHLLKGLKIIHDAGIVHRDISSQNVMLVKDDGGFRAKITDFGIASVNDSHLTSTGMGGVGKEIYCAPEQWEGLANADLRSDLYSLGILMYRMVTGKLPMGLITKQANEINPDVGNELNAWILTATEQNPNDRFANAGIMLENLTRIFSIRTSPSADKVLLKQENPVPMKESSPLFRLRSQSKVVSDNDFLNVFERKENWKKKLFISNEYKDLGSGVVIDYSTDLIWQQSGSGWIEFSEAEEYVRGLNEQRFADYDDWRLPTLDEIWSLLEPEKLSGELYIDPIFDTKQKWCWTSDKRWSGRPWPAPLDKGLVDYSYMGDHFYVRAVRSRSILDKKKQHNLRSKPTNISYYGKESALNLHSDGQPKRYIRNKYEFWTNGIVVDYATGLMWQQSGSNRTLVFKEAKAYVRDLNRTKFGDYKNWRLPTIDEFSSLVERERNSKDLRIDAIFDEKQNHCWTSDKCGWDSGWYVNLFQGLFSKMRKGFDSECYIRAVRTL